MSAGNTAAVSYQQTEVVNNATLTASGAYASNPVNVAGAGHVEVLISVTGTVSGTTPSLVVNAVVIDPVNSVAIKTYSATAITVTNSQQTIVLDDAGTNNIIGDSLNITWTITGTTPSFAGVYVRVVIKQR